MLYSHNPWNLDTLKKNNELSLKSVKKNLEIGFLMFAYILELVKTLYYCWVNNTHPLSKS